jgi:hypothetical protein
MMKTIKEIIESDLPWDREKSASPEAINSLASNSGLNLPKDYLDFLSLSNGGEGELPVDPYWFQIWSAENVLEHNEGYQVAQFLPGFFAFGSNGGGEMLAFDTRKDGAWPVYMIPFVPMEEADAREVASEFLSFAQLFGIEEENG